MPYETRVPVLSYSYSYGRHKGLLESKPLRQPTLKSDSRKKAENTYSRTFFIFKFGKRPILTLQYQVLVLRRDHNKNVPGFGIINLFFIPYVPSRYCVLSVFYIYLIYRVGNPCLVYFTYTLCTE